MRRKRQILYYLAGIAVMAAAAFAVFRMESSPRQLAGKVDEAAGRLFAEEQKARKQLYKLSFSPSKTKQDAVTAYVPRYGSDFYENAGFYCDSFGVECKEVLAPGESGAEEFARYRGAEGTLFIDRRMNRLVFTADVPPGTRARTAYDPVVSPLQAAAMAKSFLSEKALTAVYAKTEVSAAHDAYTVTLIHKLEGLYDYAFPTTVKLDVHGRLLSVDYYDFSYDRVAAPKIMSMKEACDFLPVGEEGEGVKIDVQRGALVYAFSDSIVQPAYLFEGERAEGGLVTPFACFVPAAKYD